MQLVKVTSITLSRYFYYTAYFIYYYTVSPGDRPGLGQVCDVIYHYPVSPGDSPDSTKYATLSTTTPSLLGTSPDSTKYIPLHRLSWGPARTRPSIYPYTVSPGERPGLGQVCYVHRERHISVNDSNLAVVEVIYTFYCIRFH
jgi:hypothetical protein